MVNMRSLLIFASAVAALPTLSRRDPQAILTSLQGIDTSVQGLQNAVTTWDGGLISALSIQSQASTVGVSVLSSYPLDKKVCRHDRLERDMEKTHDANQSFSEPNRRRQSSSRW